MEERASLLSEIKKEIPDAPAPKKGGRKKGGPSTYDVTLEMFHSGMDIEAIAKERGLVPGTIEGHLAKAVESGKIELHQYLSAEDFETIRNSIATINTEGFTSKDVFAKLEGKFSYAKIRVVMNRLQPSIPEKE